MANHIMVWHLFFSLMYLINNQVAFGYCLLSKRAMMDMFPHSKKQTFMGVLGNSHCPQSTLKSGSQGWVWAHGEVLVGLLHHTPKC